MKHDNPRMNRILSFVEPVKTVLEDPVVAASTSEPAGETAPVQLDEADPVGDDALIEGLREEVARAPADHGKRRGLLGLSGQG